VDVSKRVKAKEVSSVSEISAKMDKTQPAPVEALYGDDAAVTVIIASSGNRGWTWR
jgi:hypothetical protein